MSFIQRIKNKIARRKANMSWASKRKYLIEQGAVIGEGTRFNCSVGALGTEPYLVTIGNNCLIADAVHFITHDGGGGKSVE